MGWMGHVTLIGMIYTGYAWDNPDADMIALIVFSMYLVYQLYFYQILLPRVRRERQERDEKGLVGIGEELGEVEEARRNIFMGALFIAGLVGVAGVLLGFWDGSACTGIMRYQC